MVVTGGGSTKLSEDDGVEHRCSRERVSFELPPTEDVGSAVESVRDTFPEWDVTAKRTVDESGLTEGGFQAALADQLTDRQQATLEAAYLAGYFDRPRASSGEETAASLDVSPSTFHQHLRVAERKLAATFVTGPQ